MLIKSKAQKLPPQAEAIFATVLAGFARQTTHCPNFLQALLYMPRKDWTLGCIAVSNAVMDEIWQLVKDGTTIEIVP